MSLSGIFNPIVRAYFNNKGGSGGGGNENIAVDGGVLSSCGDAMYGENIIKLFNEPIPLSRIKEVYVDYWLWNRYWHSEEQLEAIRNTPCELDTVEPDDGHDRLWMVCPPDSGEWDAPLICVTADEAVVNDVTLPKGLYWRSAACYPTRIVVAPLSLD